MKGEKWNKVYSTKFAENDYLKEIFKEFESHELHEVKETLNVLLSELGEEGFYYEMPSYWTEIINSVIRGREIE